MKKLLRGLLEIVLALGGGYLFLRFLDLYVVVTTKHPIILIFLGILILFFIFKEITLED